MIRTLDRVSEESYFFRLSDYDEAFLSVYENRRILSDQNPEETKSLVSSAAACRILSVSRLKTSVSWGVPVPDDPAHTMYVWFDALTNYITAIGFGNEATTDRRLDLRNSGQHFTWLEKTFCVFTQSIGRRFYWLLASSCRGLFLPTACGWIRTAARCRRHWATRSNWMSCNKHFSIDAIRYFCLREMVFGQDGRFGYEALIDRANSDLASGLGNLSSRTLTMISRYCDARIPSA